MNLLLNSLPSRLRYKIKKLIIQAMSAAYCAQVAPVYFTEARYCDKTLQDMTKESPSDVYKSAKESCFYKLRARVLPYLDHMISMLSILNFWSYLTK